MLESSSLRQRGARGQRPRQAAHRKAVVGGLAICLLAACTAPSGSAESPLPPTHSPASVASGVRRTPTPTTSALPSATRAATSSVPLAMALKGMAVDPAARDLPSRRGAALAPVGAGPLTGRVVVVDPGHNGIYRAAVNTRPVPAGSGRTKPCNSSGTAAASGYSEHRFAWDIARRLTGELRSRGAKVVLTRPDDEGIGPCVNERAAIGNRARADLVISIHADGNLSRNARGFHLILSTAMAGGPTAEAASKDFAVLLRGVIHDETGMPRSTYIGHGTALSPRTDIAGLNLSRVPGVMLEAGNMRHPKDAALLAAPEFRARLASALAEGTVEALR